MSDETAMVIYRDLEGQFDDLYCDIIFEGKECKTCDYAVGWETQEFRPLFECSVGNNLECPALHNILNNLTGYLEAALKEKNFD